MKSDILVVHPYKHHAFNLAAGCLRSGRKVVVAVPLYRRGIGAAVARLPGPIGRKAQGYFHPGLRDAHFALSARWQLRKLWSFLGDPMAFEVEYDRYVSARLLGREWTARVVVSLQDHMPRTCAAAREIGAILWSDQISNNSATTRSRIDAHYADLGLTTSHRPEEINTRILGTADLVTVPSAYAAGGLEGRVGDGRKVRRVSYGVDTARFCVGKAVDGNAFTIIARANSIRKGGHLLLAALAGSHRRLASLVAPRRLQVLILGKCGPELDALLTQVRSLGTLSVVDDNIPHADMPALYATADLFVMPSLSEGMSLACIEAMAAGVPLIVTPYSGQDHFVPGEMGLLVHDTVESVESALLQAVGDPESVGQWSRNVRDVAAGLSWDRYERAISEVACTV